MWAGHREWEARQAVAEVLLPLEIREPDIRAWAQQIQVAIPRVLMEGRGYLQDQVGEEVQLQEIRVRDPAAAPRQPQVSLSRHEFCQSGKNQGILMLPASIGVEFSHWRWIQ